MAARAWHAGWRLGLAVLAWGAGLAWQLRQPALMPQAWHAGALACGVGLLAAARWRGGRRGGLPALLLALLLLGWASTGWRAQARLDERLDPALEGVDLLVTGVVAQMPQVGASGTRLRLEVESASLNGRAVRLPPALALGWYRGLHEDSLLAGPLHTLRAGQRWTLPVRLKLPHGTLNPEGFDARAVAVRASELRAHRLRAGGQRPRAAQPQKLADAAATPGGAPAPAPARRPRLREVADPRAAGVLAALAVGDQARDRTRNDWDLFRNTGVAHLIVDQRACT